MNKKNNTSRTRYFHEAQLEKLLTVTELFAPTIRKQRLYLEHALDEELITEEEYIRRIVKMIDEFQTIMKPIMDEQMRVDYSVTHDVKILGKAV